ncbi:hypothetical protein SAMN04490244_103299 [Tranquillimonas rosea]|uniref:Uncharacterized protein n=1 Tax=Tranquillimonas rosea TaxID=641238 RepID=A0A1H9SPY3_9RHOB|nr:hypothetical protein [Tranquillimonas rosea]SER86399.1 hypothetical protein SAMN04490244_103299 [Tranquillimonas rosea]
MFDWIMQHKEIIQILVQIATAIVWMLYLHLFLTSFVRQRRSNILINRVAGNNDRAHLLVGNMGAEPIYVSSLIADLDIAGETVSAVVTDREDFLDNEASNAVSCTTQGPLDSGQYRDLGNFSEIMEKALRHLGRQNAKEEVSRLVVTVAAESGHDAFLAAGQQSFTVSRDGDSHVFLPETTRTRQIRSRKDRRRLGVRINSALREEAEAIRSNVESLVPRGTDAAA